MPLDNEDIKQLIAILQKGLSDEPKNVNVEESKPTSNKKNKFEQMPEFRMFKEDTEFDKKISKPPPSARLRQFEPITVKCRVCGKTEEISPQLVESVERYKCNKCSTGAG